MGYKRGFKGSYTPDAIKQRDRIFYFDNFETGSSLSNTLKRYDILSNFVRISNFLSYIVSFTFEI